MKNIIAKYTCDICEKEADELNYYGRLLMNMNPETIDGFKLHFIESGDKQLHLCKDCAQIVGAFVNLINK